MLLEIGILAGVCAWVYFARQPDQDPDQDQNPDQDQDPDREADQDPKLETEAADHQAALEDKLTEKTPQVRRATALGGTAMVLAFAANRSRILGLASTALLSYLLAPIYIKTWNNWQRDREITNDIVFSLFSFFALVRRHNVAIAFGVFAYGAGTELLKRTAAESRKLAMNSLDLLPNRVWRVEGESEVEVPFSEIRVGDIVIVDAGGVVPSDGQVVSGHALVDEQALTGEAQPVEKHQGERVLASTLVVSGRLFVEVEQAGEQTTVVQIGKMLTDTATYKTPVQLKGERWANLAAKPTLIAAALALPLLGPDRALVVLHSSFGNRLRLLAPLTTLNFLNLTAKRSVLVKSGLALERVPDVDTVLFDKTGTLTLAVPRVGLVEACAELDPAEVLELAAAAESRQNHPIGKAILQAARERGLEPGQATDREVHLGYGLSVGLDDGRLVQVGSLRFLALEEIPVPPEIVESRDRAHAAGNTLVAVAVDGRVVGSITVEPQLRPEALQVVDGLRERGIGHIAIVSGDHERPTRALAETLGLDAYFAEVLPGDKAKIVEQMQERGRVVCFVGDGINDSVAMQRADVSVSLTGASAVATDMAQVIMLDGTLTNLGELFDLAEQLNRNLKRSLAIIASGSVINLVGAIFFGLTVNKSVVLKSLVFFVAMGNAALPLASVRRAEGLASSSGS